MKHADKQIRKAGFARRLHERVGRERPELASKLTEEDHKVLIDLFFDELSSLLKSGFRVVFEGYASFFTKPIKRTCTNVRKIDDGIVDDADKWSTFKRRLRWKPLPKLKESEVDLTEEEYTELEKKKETKTPTSIS